MDGEWFGVAASAAGGGLFGVVGTVLGRVAGYFETRQQHEFERAKWQHETVLLDMQMQASREETEAEIELMNTQGSWDGLAASITADAALPGSYPIVDAIRSLTRPVLTLLLWVITTLIFFNIGTEFQNRIVETSVFAATAATLWWFGDRAVPNMRQHGSGV